MISHRDQFYQCADLFPEAVLITDTDGIVLMANQAAHRHLAAFRIDGQFGALLSFASAPEVLRAYLRACGRTKSFLPGTVTLSMGDAHADFKAEGALFAAQDLTQPRQILLRLTPKHSAASRFVALNSQIDQLSREIERRRRAEEEVTIQRERFRVTLTGIGDAVIATDVNAIITFLNPVAETLTGWPAAESIGKPLDTVFRIINEETRQPVQSPVERVIRAGTIVALANHSLLIRRDGSEVPIDDSGSPIRSADNAVIGAVLVCHDISERRRLERDVEIRTLELEEEHRRKDEFLAMLGHELRNPLAPIKAALEIQALPHSSDQVRKRAMDIMTRQVDHLTRLVDELLDVARISTGKINLNQEFVEVGAVIQRASELCQPLIEAKGQNLSVELHTEQMYVLGDLQRLTQVFGNLINNASKYTQRGGCLRMAVSYQNGIVEIAVADNGMGIDSSTLPRIFDVFSQSDRTLARSEGGLGVGLTLARRLIEQHGGTIEAQSAGLGKGSTFRVRLPLAASPVLVDVDDALNLLPGTGDQKILIVDDNSDAAEMLSQLLQTYGHQVTVAFSGVEALASAALNPPDFVFLDIGLPDLDGYSVGKALRAKPETGEAVIVAVTGYGQADDIRKSKEAGFNHHLVKPVDMRKLLKILALSSGP